MGSMRAIGMMEVVEKGLVDLDVVLIDHLRYNHYPPLPLDLLPVAKTALDLADLGEWDSKVDMPNGIRFRDQDTATVSQIVETMHLDAFVREEGI